MSIIGAERLESLLNPEDLRTLEIPDNPRTLGLFEGYGGLTDKRSGDRA
jgi:hypothetical protein